MFKAYLQNELPDEYISGDKGIGWFDLHKIRSTCPAKWKFEEREFNNVTAIVEHAAILNPTEFENRFVREPVKEDYPHALTSDAAITAWLKERGVGGYSGKKYDALTELVKQTGDKPLIWKEFIEEFNQYIGKKAAVTASVFDKTLQMRAVIFGNEKFSKQLDGAFNDVTIIGELNGVKIHVRYDSITPSGVIIDYVGCTSASPDEFGSQARRGGYYLKQALLYDIFTEAYGQAPSEQLILAQERGFPHIPEKFIITQDDLEIGRIQYRAALELYKQCSEKNVWPTYSLSDDAINLSTPEWYKKQYGLGEK